MLNPSPWMARLLAPAVLLFANAGPALGQIEALRNSDDQFIQGLRERGMSDLLGRFVEADPPQDPIAKLALDVALKEFVADDQLERAREMFQAGQVAEGNALFLESRRSFEGVLDAQEKLIADHAEDERLPLWQTDYAEMLLFRYLPRYYQNVNWVYEFGLPSDEQRSAYEGAMVKAFKALDDATYRHDMRATRAGADAELRPRLESMGIWYKLEDYRQINTPYWYAQAAHGVSLLPETHPYYQNKQVRNQKLDPPAEKKRLRNVVVDALSFGVIQDERTKTTAKLFSGRTLAWSKDPNDIEEAVGFLEDVIDESADGPQGFVATLGKAVAYWSVGQPGDAMDILGGMERNGFVKGDSSTTTRLLVADLVFKIKRAEAMEALPGDRPKLIAEAYEAAYVPLVDKDDDDRYRGILFERWAAGANNIDDPMSVPPMVRMGIGEMLTQQGGYQAQVAIQGLAGPEPAIEAEVRSWRMRLEEQAEQADEVLARAAAFNETLIGEDMQGAVLARGLYNLAMDLYWRAELVKAFQPEKQDWNDHFRAAERWLAVGERAPDAALAEQSLKFAINLMVGMDVAFNTPDVQQANVRKAYRRAFELLMQQWPQVPEVHNNRVYAAFHLFEKNAEWDKAIEVYRGLPRDHHDYFQARRQMMFVMQRQYRQMSDRLRLLKATEPSADPPPNVDPEAHAQKRREWQAEVDTLEIDLGRVRDGITEEAQLVILDAEDEAENARDGNRRFTAATALGAAKVVLAGVEADRDPAKGRALLEGFETRFAPDGDFGKLAQVQADPAKALQNLRGLVQAAQQQRILILLEAKQFDEMVAQAQQMMQVSPDVAAGVINGVLNRVRTTIERERRAEQEAVFEVVRQRARENIRFQAQAAVKLGEELVNWAKGQGFNAKQMVPYRLELADSWMLAGNGQKALTILDPLSKQFPQSFEIAMQTGKAHLSMYQDPAQKDEKHYNGAMDNFNKVIAFYNVRNEKPAIYWDAWLQVFYLLEATGDGRKADIGKRAKSLLRIDPDFGGAQFKDKFLDVIERNGGIQ
ncbi:MAG: hypothetical protein ACE37H_07295 [Phycisphaeraceae bacterium]